MKYLPTTDVKRIYYSKHYNNIYLVNLAFIINYFIFQRDAIFQRKCFKIMLFWPVLELDTKVGHMLATFIHSVDNSAHCTVYSVHGVQCTF